MGEIDLWVARGLGKDNGEINAESRIKKEEIKQSKNTEIIINNINLKKEEININFESEHKKWLVKREGLKYARGKDGKVITKWKKTSYDSLSYSPNINLIQLRPDEIVIEYDTPNREDAEKFIAKTLEALEKDNIGYLMFDHKGRCSHIHFFADSKLSVGEKKALLLKYGFDDSIDKSLAEDNHFIACPYAKHYKYGNYKELIKKFDGELIKKEDIPKVSYIEISDEVADNELFALFVNKGFQVINRKVLCPFHPDHDPSMIINSNNAYCFAEQRAYSKREIFEYFKEPYNDIKLFQSEIKDFIVNKERNVAQFKLAKRLMEDYKFFTLYETDDLYVNINGIYVRDGMKIVREFTQAILSDNACIHTTNEVVGHLKRSTIKTKKEVDEEEAPINLICLDNGLFDLNTKEILPFDHNAIFFNKIPVKYDSNADCPKIKKFLNEILSPSDIPMVQEFIGYCLYRQMPFHKALMLVGNGRNGKSTLINLIRIFLGENSCSAIPLQTLENNRFSLVHLYGKLANMFADLPNIDLDRTSMFKSLTGEDTIFAEEKFQQGFFYKNYAKLIFSANQLPKSNDDTDAFFERWKILTFNNQFIGKNSNPVLIKELITEVELSGFFNFALEGLFRLLNNEGFSTNQSTEELREEYLKKSDSAAYFISERIEIDQSYINKPELYSAYCQFCKSHKIPILSEMKLSMSLISTLKVYDARIYNESGERVRVWKGIKLIDEEKLVKNEEIKNSEQFKPISQKMLTVKALLPMESFLLPDGSSIRWSIGDVIDLPEDITIMLIKKKFVMEV